MPDLGLVPTAGDRRDMYYTHAFIDIQLSTSMYREKAVLRQNATKRLKAAFFASIPQDHGILIGSLLIRYGQASRPRDNCHCEDHLGAM